MKSKYARDWNEMNMLRDEWVWVQEKYGMVAYVLSLHNNADIQEIHTIWKRNSWAEEMLMLGATPSAAMATTALRSRAFSPTLVDGDGSEADQSVLINHDDVSEFNLLFLILLNNTRRINYQHRQECKDFMDGDWRWVKCNSNGEMLWHRTNKSRVA